LKTYKLTLFAAGLVFLGGCTGTPPKPAQSTVAANDVTIEQINIAIDNGVKLQNEKGEEMVCRREAKTGSRLARETICMTQAEWSNLSEESQRSTQKSMRLGKIPHGT